MTNTKNPMYRKDLDAVMGFGELFLAKDECPDGIYVLCEDVVRYIKSLQEQELTPEEILTKVLEGLS